MLVPVLLVQRVWNLCKEELETVLPDLVLALGSGFDSGVSGVLVLRPAYLELISGRVALFSRPLLAGALFRFVGGGWVVGLLVAAAQANFTVKVGEMTLCVVSKVFCFLLSCSCTASEAAS